MTGVSHRSNWLLADSRLLGSWPETGLEEINRDLPKPTSGPEITSGLRLGVEEDFEGFENYWLLPAKNLRRERRAHDKRQGQCCQVARVRPPRVALPNPFEQ